METTGSIEVRDGRGAKFTLPAAGSGPTYVLFFATWCPYCRKALDALPSYLPPLLAAGLTLHLVDMTEMPSDVLPFLAEKGIDGKTLSPRDPSRVAVFFDPEELAWDAWDLPCYPTHTVFDAAGRRLFFGGVTPPEEIERALRAAVAAAAVSAGA